MELNYYTTEEIATLLKVDIETVRRWLRDGKLKGIKAGDSWRVAERELTAFLSNASEG